MKRTTIGTRPQGEKAFSLIEILFVLAIIGIISAIAIPMTKNIMKSYHLSAGEKAITGAIQSTRYLAIMRGYHYNITFNKDTRTYQIASKLPPATTFSNVGNLVPWSLTPDVSMTPNTTLEFFPGGTIAATTGTMTLTITNGTAIKTITVSAVGNINVTP